MYKYFIFIVLFVSTACFAEPFTMGKDYQIIKIKEDMTPATDAIMITEFFSYGCPWCYRLESKLNQWVAAQGNNVAYQKIPVVFNADWEYYAKAFYAVQALSSVQKLSPALFNAILKDKQQLNSNKAMVAFLIAQGVDPDFARNAFYHSSSIEMEIGNSNRMMVAYKIGGVPAVVVGNKYKTDLQMAGSETRLFSILDYLVKKAEQDKESGNH